MRVLLVEDNPDIAGAVSGMLARRNFAVEVATDGDDGLDRLLRGGYDVAVIDIMLPKQDGFMVCRAARAEGIATPVLILSARDAVEDRIRGLDCGADDYLVKPFVEEELAARIRALLRRAAQPPAPAEMCVGSLRIDARARNATVGGKPLELGATEFRLLEYLATNCGAALTRAQILEKLWDYDYAGSSNIIDVYVGQLRRKLKALGATAVIHTVWGVGYKLDDSRKQV